MVSNQWRLHCRHAQTINTSGAYKKRYVLFCLSLFLTLFRCHSMCIQIFIIEYMRFEWRAIVWVWLCMCMPMFVCVPIYPSFIGEQIWLLLERQLEGVTTTSVHVRFTSIATVPLFVARLFSTCVWFCVWFLTHAYDDDSSAYNDISHSFPFSIVWAIYSVVIHLGAFWYSAENGDCFGSLSVSFAYTLLCVGIESCCCCDCFQFS